MKEKELSALSDEALLDEAKKPKINPTTNALFIGIMVGIIIYSIAVNSLGFFTLIPLFFIYKLIGNSKKQQAVEALLKERNLK